MKLLAFGVVLQEAAITFSKCKDTKSQEQNKIKSFIFYAETEYLRDFIAKIQKKSQKCKKNEHYFCISLNLHYLCRQKPKKWTYATY